MRRLLFPIFKVKLNRPPYGGPGIPFPQSFLCGRIMKRFFTLLVFSAFVSVFGLYAQDGIEAAAGPKLMETASEQASPELVTTTDETAVAEQETQAIDNKSIISYAFGVSIGKSIKSTGVEIDYDVFLIGVKEYLETGGARIGDDDANFIIQMAIEEAMSVLSAANAAKEQEFLAENAKREGILTTESGLQYEVLKEGEGIKPTMEDTVKVDYIGTLLDGTQFDSSVDRGEPAIFPLNSVIEGWAEAILLMPVGSKYKIYIPSALAYGEYGINELIGPSATLIFEVDLLSIEPAAAE